MKTNRPQAFHYLDYRSLLEDYYNYARSISDGQFSYRAFSKLAGFKSSSYVRKVVLKKRNISSIGMNKLVNAMKFDDRERDYFEHLVKMNQAETREEMNYHLKKISSYKEFKESYELTEDDFEFFSSWHPAALRELITFKNFNMNLTWIKKKLRFEVTEEEIKSSFKLLERLEMIKKHASGRWITTQPHSRTANEVSSHFIKIFQREMMEKAILALDDIEPDLRDLSCMTMSIHPEHFTEIKQRIIECRNNIQKYIAENPKPAKLVYQLNYQFFPLAD